MNWRLGSQQKSEQYNKGLESITLPNCLCGDIQRDKLEEKLEVYHSNISVSIVCSVIKIVYPDLPMFFTEII
jgi:hypothetical protein